MNIDLLIDCGYIAASIIIIGLILLSINHHFKKERQVEIMKFIDETLPARIRSTMLDIMIDGMDIIPSKLMDAKRTLERNDSEWIP